MGDQPWERRRARLEQLDLPAVARLVPIGPVDLFWETTADLGLEGVVAKRLDSRYAPGRRASSWIRAKHWRTTTMRIAGYNVDPVGRLAGVLVTPDRVPGAIIARVELGLHGPPRRLLSEYLPQLRTAAKADVVFVEPCVRVAIRHHGEQPDRGIRLRRRGERRRSRRPARGGDRRPRAPRRPRPRPCPDCVPPNSDERARLYGCGIALRPGRSRRVATAPTRWDRRET